MKFFAIFALAASGAARCQAPAAAPVDAASRPPTGQDVPAASITVRSNLVVVPALVRTRSGQLVYTLKADDFLLTDDGIEQKLHLEEDTGDQPLALVICVETGASGVDHLNDYHDLGTMLETMIGSVEHKVAVVGFDSTPVLLHGFTSNIDFVAHSLTELDTGDNGGAVLDGIVFAVDQLRTQPPKYRRAILLLSETVDQGSHAKLVDALRAISDTNTVIYSVGFASTKSQIRAEAGKLNFDEPGPEHGCFTRDKDEDGNTIVPTDSAGRPVSRATQNFDCFAELLPPLRLAKIAEIAARNSLRRNVSSSVARVTGGESFKFKDVKTLQKDLFTISNHIPNRYVLSFHPQQPVPGFHTITLSLRDYSHLSVEARNGYWVEDQHAAKPFATAAAVVSSVVSAQSTVNVPQAEGTDSGFDRASITSRSNLVIVPALVRNRSKQLVYSLKAQDFLVTDNGVEQKLRLEEDTGGQPIAMVVCVETGSFGREHFADYRNLTTMLESMVGGVQHTVAVVGFDSTATVLHGFTSSLDFIGTSLNELDAGDQGAAILDGLMTSVDLLHQQPAKYRRAVLLLSETLDRGSHAKLDEALRAVSDTNTVIYSVAFSSSKASLAHENRKFGWRFQPPLPPGPKHGCFSRDLGTDADGRPIQPGESQTAQNLNCIEEILPPLRLAKLAQIGAQDALRQNVSEAVAGLTGGETFDFNDAKSLQGDLFTISNHIPNRYVLSFHPQQPAAGFHAIALRLRDKQGLSVEARSGYWVEDQGAAETVPAKP